MTPAIFDTKDLEKEILPKIKRGSHIVWFNTNKWAFEKVIKLTNQRLAKKVREAIDEWQSACIIKYDDECPYCQRHQANVIIFTKELKKTLFGEDK